MIRLRSPKAVVGPCRCLYGNCCSKSCSTGKENVAQARADFRAAKEAGDCTCAFTGKWLGEVFDSRCTSNRCETGAAIVNDITDGEVDYYVRMGG